MPMARKVELGRSWMDLASRLVVNGSVIAAGQSAAELQIVFAGFLKFECEDMGDPAVSGKGLSCFFEFRCLAPSSLVRLFELAVEILHRLRHRINLVDSLAKLGL